MFFFFLWVNVMLTKIIKEWIWEMKNTVDSDSEHFYHLKRTRVKVWDILSSKSLRLWNRSRTIILKTQRRMYSFELRKTRNCVNGCCVEWFLKNINKMDVQIQASTAGLFTVANIYESLHNINYPLLHNIA